MQAAQAPARLAAWREQDTAFLAAGGFLLAMGLMVIVVTGFLVVIVAVLIPFFIGPGVVLLALGWHAHRVEAELVDFTTRLRMYRRIKIDDLARTSERSRIQIERLLARAIDMGFLRGVIDRATDEFVLEDTVPQQVYVEVCPSCGGRVGRWAFPEERFPCPYCSFPRGRDDRSAPPLNSSRHVIGTPSREVPSWAGIRSGSGVHLRDRGHAPGGERGARPRAIAPRGDPRYCGGSPGTGPSGAHGSRGAAPAEAEAGAPQAETKVHVRAEALREVGDVGERLRDPRRGA